MKTLAIVPARGGSKGIPKKNIKLLGGKPLIQYTAEIIHESDIFTRAILSTDSEEIAGVGRSCGLEVPFLRPSEFAQDDTPILSVLQHLFGFLKERNEEPDLFFILQPTSPFRKMNTLRKCMEILTTTDADSAVGVVEIPPHFSPYYAMKVENDGSLVNFLPEGKKISRRQDAPKAYSRSGTVYAVRYSSFLRTGSIYGDKCLPVLNSSEEAVNIDSPEDWEMAEYVWKKMHNA